MPNQGNADHPLRWAWGATCEEEEQLAFVGRVHSALAASLRLQNMLADLEHGLRTASKDLRINRRVMRIVLEACGLDTGPCNPALPGETLQGVQATLLSFFNSLKPSGAKEGHGTPGAEDAGDPDSPTRAFDAFTLQEEQHAVLGKAFLILAADIPALSAPAGEMCRRARRRYNDLGEEMQLAIQKASTAICSDKPTMLVALKAHGRCLEYCSLELRADPTAVLAAMSTEPAALEHASWELRSDRSFVAQAMAVCPLAFEHASDHLRADRDLALTAVAEEPSMFEHVSVELRGSREVALAVLTEQTQQWTNGREFDEEDEITLQYLSPQLRADKELVLEAVKVSGAAWQYASPGLRGDKDFFLHVLRTAPQRDQRRCYNEVDAALQETPFEEYQGAAASALALPGESAPVLNVILASAASPAKKRRRTQTNGTNISSFEVSLLSGASFTCSLQSEEAGSDDADPHINESGQPKPCSTMAELATLLLAELPKHAQLDPPPERIFVVFVQDGVSGEATPVTPWDWNRPLSDFI